MVEDAYVGIRFRYSAVSTEIINLSSLAADLLAPGSADVLARFNERVSSARISDCGKTHRLEIPRDEPVKTKATDQYRGTGKGGSHRVYGTLSCCWEIENVDRSIRRQTHFVLIGIASTSVCLHLEKGDALVGRWQFEGGDKASPGCHFHSAVNQYEKDGLFPEWLKVPRFPAILFTPMDALEFLLGELFQGDWEKTVSEDSYARNGWSKQQSERLQRLLKWQLDKVANPDTTPWMTLKRAKPPLDVVAGD